MSRIQIVREPTPAPRRSGKPAATLACHIRYMLNGKEVGSDRTGPWFENERQTRKERKY